MVANRELIIGTKEQGSQETIQETIDWFRAKVTLNLTPAKVVKAGKQMSPNGLQELQSLTNGRSVDGGNWGDVRNSGKASGLKTKLGATDGSTQV